MKQADAICAAYTSETKAVDRPRSYAQIVAYVQKTLPLYEAALRRLEALRPPSRDAQAVHDLGAGALRRDFPTVTTAASRAELAGSQSRSAAAGLGMKVCARLVSGR